jgi:hypothetical protein
MLYDDAHCCKIGPDTRVTPGSANIAVKPVPLGMAGTTPLPQYCRYTSLPDRSDIASARMHAREEKRRRGKGEDVYRES